MPSMRKNCKQNEISTLYATLKIKNLSKFCIRSRNIRSSLFCDKYGSLTETCQKFPESAIC